MCTTQAPYCEEDKLSKLVTAIKYNISYDRGTKDNEKQEGASVWFPLRATTLAEEEMSELSFVKRVSSQ